MTSDIRRLKHPSSCSTLGCMSRLVFIEGKKRHILDISKVFRIGRHPDNDLVLKDSQVSRWHAEIREEKDHYCIIDLESLNGTRVNSKRIQQQRLNHGDEIEIGPFRLTWLEKEDVAEKADEQIFSSWDIVKPVKSFTMEELPPIKEGTPPKDFIKSPEKIYLLLQVSRLLNTSHTLEDFLRSTLDMTLSALGADRGAILLVEQGELKPCIQRGGEENFGDCLPISSTITSKVLYEGLGVLTTDARFDPRFNQGESIRGYDVLSVLCVPLWESGTARGVLYLDNHVKAKAFTESDLELVTAVAHQLAVGIRHHETIKKMKEEAVIRHQLEKYHSPDVVDMLMKQISNSHKFEFAAEERVVTVLFCDIVDFSSLARELKPAETANLLSHFFDEMTSVIFKHKGSVNKFMGDAVMALWGAPFSHGNDEERACRCSADMMRALYKFLTRIDSSKWFKVRIGINTGEVIAGHIGSLNMLEYTVIGDSVNIAARIQEHAKPNQILIGERTRRALGHDFPTVDLGHIQLEKGLNNIKVYELLWKEIPPTL